ncbi:Ig-like domain-containing protein [Wenjunlia tyrosinilytica]|nr:Ig-like domain-containing protein [Wenjunlia tyrosinilytica]
MLTLSGLGGVSRADSATLGSTQIGDHSDFGDSGYMNSVRVTTGAMGGTVTSVSVYVGSVGPAPGNKFEVAVYSDSDGSPDELLGKSGTGTLTANSWNTIAVSAALTPDTAYWLAYNTNGADVESNNLRYTSGGRSAYSTSGTPFGTWPQVFGPATFQTLDFSMYATYTPETPVPPAPDNGPGGPILLITDPADPFTRYYAEILKAEGLNEYRVSDLSDVTASALGDYDIAVLGRMPLTDAQASMLGGWVGGGGKLVAMRPDKKLAPLLGLNDTGSTLAEGYLKVNTSAAPGAGITGDTMQYHGTADRYSLGSATAVATLYSSATTATTSPAVTVRSVGSNGGRAAAFTYDLARSVVLTRQGNAAWAGQQRDSTDGYEASEMFYGTGGQPDWNNLDKALIPIADEQQRLLVNTITHLTAPVKPLPRLWYFPRDLKAVVIMSGDDHANGGTAGRWDHYIAQSPAGCSVADWECVRASSYVYNGSPLTSAQAKGYTDQGFEVGLHVTTLCRPWGATPLDTYYGDQLSVWKSKYSTIPKPSSSRTHCVEWDDWSTQARMKKKYGMRLDQDYYYYPASFTKNRPGYFNGTGEIMRFAEQDGQVIDTYQATTQLTDESGQSYPYTIDTLLDAAYGAQGYYAALGANMHTDSVASSGSDAIVASAQARGVPIVSGRQMLTWLDDRNSSAFADLQWSGDVLSFKVTGGARGLRAMVPLNSSGGVLSGVTFNGSAVPVRTDTVKGVPYAFFDAGPGSFRATYAPDTTAPTVTSTSPADNATDVKVTDPVKVTFSEPMDSSTITSANLVLRDSAGHSVQTTVTYDPATKAATLAPTLPLATSNRHTVTVDHVGDAAGNELAAPYSFSFTTSASATSSLGNTQVGNHLDDGDSNHMNGSRVTTGSAQAVLKTASVHVGSVSASPNNKFQLAVYTDSNGKPGTLVAATASGTLTANAWNSLPITATLNPNTSYWLMYNTNGTTIAANNMHYSDGGSGQGAYSTGATTFGTWPANFGNATQSTALYSIYVTY